MSETKSTFKFTDKPANLITLMIGTETLKSFSPTDADKVDVEITIVEKKGE